MARRKQNHGTCAFCKKEYTKGGMRKHLAACSDYQGAVRKAEASKRKAQNLYHLVLSDAFTADFWLHLEMNGSARLEDLDHYLRAIWLECCGHLSEFQPGKRPYQSPELDMNLKADDVFPQTKELIHLYDFGTTSETLVEAVGVRKGKPLTSHPIALLARNNLPEVSCKECEKPARFLCMECIYEEDESGLLCEAHAKTHPHDEYGEPAPLYNSPRTGMCGYDGPAEPPY
jgi:hypothetical protein